jgi:hypothetical protein
VNHYLDTNVPLYADTEITQAFRDGVLRCFAALRIRLGCTRASIIGRKPRACAPHCAPDKSAREELRVQLAFDVFVEGCFGHCDCVQNTMTRPVQYNTRDTRAEKYKKTHHGATEESVVCESITHSIPQSYLSHSPDPPFPVTFQKIIKLYQRDPN